MKIIFLDFDGVLNSTSFLIKMSDDEKSQEGWVTIRDENVVDWWSRAIDEKLVEKLNVIIKRTGSVVVVSSSWRIGARLKFLRDVLNRKGFEGEIIGKTRYLLGQPRSDEIKKWIQDYRRKIDSFVILDDDSDAGIQGHFVNTQCVTGLTDDDVEKAVMILGETLE